MPQNIQVKSILNKTKHRDKWFLDDYTVNPYSGCSFNCLFCYIRGSKYGVNMEERLSVKANAVELLDKALALRAKKNQYGIIVFSSATDPYLQFEKEQLLTRNLLEVVLKHRFPVHIITRSDLVVRDFDLLEEIDERVKKNERVLVTTLTKRMAEELTKYMDRVGVKCRYIHSEVDTLQRVELLRELRDSIVGRGRQFSRFVVAAGLGINVHCRKQHDQRTR